MEMVLVLARHTRFSMMLCCRLYSNASMCIHLTTSQFEKAYVRWAAWLLMCIKTLANPAVWLTGRCHRQAKAVTGGVPALQTFNIVCKASRAHNKLQLIYLKICGTWCYQHLTVRMLSTVCAYRAGVKGDRSNNKCHLISSVITLSQYTNPQCELL